MVLSLSKKLFEKLRRRSYRQAYVAEHVRTGVALQVRGMREQRGLSQAALGKKMGKPQSVISRMEDPDYGKLSVQTLLDIAGAYDVALIVKFTTFRDFIWQTRDVSPATLKISSFDETTLRSEPAPRVVTRIIDASQPPTVTSAYGFEEQKNLVVNRSPSTIASVSYVGNA